MQTELLLARLEVIEEMAGEANVPGVSQLARVFADYIRQNNKKELGFNK